MKNVCIIYIFGRHHNVYESGLQVKKGGRVRGRGIVGQRPEIRVPVLQVSAIIDTWQLLPDPSIQPSV